MKRDKSHVLCILDYVILFHMIYLKFVHSRNIFVKECFKKWILDYFPSARFMGTETGNWGPTLRISIVEFLKNKNKIPTSDIVSVSGSFSIIHQLTLGVRDFSNSIV